MNDDRRLAVIGLGYVGLPLAISFVEAGLEVEGVDAHPRPDRGAECRPIADRRHSRCPAQRRDRGGPAGRRDRRGSARRGGRRSWSASRPRSTQPRIPTSGRSCRPPSSSANLRKGQLIILQSTTFPGTTTGPFRKVLEQSGLIAGRDFDLAFAPERVNPGDPASAAKDVPGWSARRPPTATARAAALLRRINDAVIELSSPDAAELAKLLENIFRNVNIALVNQLALLCERMGLDVWEVI